MAKLDNSGRERMEIWVPVEIRNILREKGREYVIPRSPKRMVEDLIAKNLRVKPWSTDYLKNKKP